MTAAIRAPASAGEISIEKRTLAATQSVDLSRIDGLDAARFLAALGTIWVHAQADPEFGSPSAMGRFAVPFFCFIAGWFLVRGLRTRPALGYLTSRAGHLLIPFALWTGIYFALRIVSAHLVGDARPITVGPETILVGSMYHLWFLPFLILSTTLLAPIVVATRGRRDRAVVVGWSLIAVGTAIVLCVAKLVPLLVPNELAAPGLTLGYFVDRALHRLPALLWGAGAALLWERDLRARITSPRARLGLAISGVTLTVACMAYYWHHGRTPIASNFAGVAWMAVALGLTDTRVARALAPFGRLSFGIYLFHPLVIAILYKLVDHAGPTRPKGVEIVIFLIAVCTSIVAVSTIRRSRIGSRLVP